jgi:predicted metalloprotease
MQWQGQRESDNVEDRRGMPGGPMMISGGLGTIAIVILVALLGGDPIAFLQQLQNGPQQGQQQRQQQGPPEPGLQDDERPERHDPARRDNGRHDVQKEFVSVVLADTEDVWDDVFREMGRTYRKPRLVLYTGHTSSGCGAADSAIGPFYCPVDETIYLDLGFFAELRNRFGAPGEFAQAYVIAHEVGHHVQKLLGTMEKVDSQRRHASKTESNHLSVRLELQADFLAGVWANRADRAKHIIEGGDVEAALRAAQAIGDDQLQRQARGYVIPDSFTHGTSAQRIHWFRLGLETGDLKQGDTFRSRDL